MVTMEMVGERSDHGGFGSSTEFLLFRHLNALVEHGNMTMTRKHEELGRLPVGRVMHKPRGGGLGGFSFTTSILSLNFHFLTTLLSS
jgi:hypothetical protein